MANKELENRIKQAAHQSFYKPWYRRPLGRIIIFFILIFLIFLTIYLYQTAKYVNKINNFDITKTVADLQADPNFTKLVTGDDPFIGSVDADVVIVAFEDFECPFCLEAQAPIKRMLEKYGDKVMFIFKDFPLSTIHSNAEEAALAANCAFEQDSFWEYHDQLYARQAELSPVTYRRIAESLGLDIAKFNICLNTKKFKAAVDVDYQTGLDLGVVGTPTFFINGQIFQGVLPDNYWDGIIPLLIKE